MPRLSGTLQPTSLYHAESFANFEGILGFSVQSFILLDLLGNTRSIEKAKKVMLFSFIVGEFQSLFFCVCVSRFVACAVCDRPVSGNVD